MYVNVCTEVSNKALLWFRNDIRIEDNPALVNAIDNGVTEAIFIATPKQWHEHNWSAIKVDFLRRHVEHLSEQLKQFNIHLTVIEVNDFAEQITFLKNYCLDNDIRQVFANSELEFNEVKRDNKIIEIGIPLSLTEADVVVPKGAVLNKIGEPYKVFTPFSKAWLAHVRQHSFPFVTVKTFSGNLYNNNISKNTFNWSYPVKDSSAWPLADLFLKNNFVNFLNSGITRYKNNRDIPSVDGTAKISPYLAIGAISPRYVLNHLLHIYPDLLLGSPEQPATWLNELIWREFYRNLLFHFPNLCCHYNYNEQYNNLEWLNNKKHFEAWCNGNTGYPIVDAAMKQLTQTGWMHNRLRMIVASFLTKHLLIDWRWGEQYFMQHLIDGDLASNNGGWQWAASTGCDAQPYFRIFNPINQSKRFDPTGTFIRRYIPELIGCSDKDIHFPSNAQRVNLLAQKSLVHDDVTQSESPDYSLPIVDHRAARERALTCFKRAKAIQNT